jgi:hypothetical protein
MRAWCRWLLLLLATAAVEPAPAATELRLLGALPEAQAASVAAVVADAANITLRRSTVASDPLQALTTRQVDLVLAENSRPFVDGVRAVLPLFEAVVHIAVRRDRAAQDAGAARLPRVELVGAQHAAALVTELLFERVDTAGADYRIWDASLADLPDLTVYVGPILPAYTPWFRDGFELLSLERIDSARAEFFTEGISYLHPQLRPTRIPALTYRLPGNEAGIATLGVDMLLLTHRDVDAGAIFRLTRALLEQAPRLAAHAPQLFRWLREDFSEAGLSFPLHEGARAYLNRDEPGFLERYAEMLNFLVYLIALLVTALLTAARWRARRRKERIDRFYAAILDLRRRADAADPDEILAALRRLEDDAFELLMGERLAADESFRIFMELAAGLRRDLLRQRDAVRC